MYSYNFGSFLCEFIMIFFCYPDPSMFPEVDPDTTVQCFGSGRIRIIWPDPDPHPHQETLTWIRLPKKNRDKLAYKSTNYKNIIFFKVITNFFYIRE